MAAGQQADVLKYTLLSGLAFYVYNEVCLSVWTGRVSADTDTLLHLQASFLALSRLSPVSHSVANTLKRVIIIVASCIVFKVTMLMESILNIISRLCIATRPR